MDRTWGQHVVAAASAAVAALAPLADRGWEVPAGALTWTCRSTAAHIAHDLVTYAAQLAGRVDDGYLRLAVTVPDDEPPAALVRTIEACGRVLAAVVDGAPTDARAWHWGPTDPSGFAAMGIAEVLVHTYDITLGLGQEWRPPADLAALVVDRLGVGTPEADDGSALLLWSTGRIDLPGLDHVEAWVWRAASR